MIVLDTNVLSELMRPSPEPVVEEWVRTHDERPHTTSITVAEIGYGIDRLPEGRRRDVLKADADEVFAAFEGYILAFDAGAAKHYPVIVTRRDRAGLPIDGFDAQIASICARHDAALATRNLKDFESTGIEVLDPWRTA